MFHQEDASHNTVSEEVINWVRATKQQFFNVNNVNSLTKLLLKPTSPDPHRKFSVCLSRGVGHLLTPRGRTVEVCGMLLFGPSSSQGLLQWR